MKMTQPPAPRKHQGSEEISTVSENTTTTSNDAYRYTDSYIEVYLLRALHYIRNYDALALCEEQDPAALYSTPRQLILTTLLDTARDALARGAGDRAVSPTAVYTRLQALGGPEAHTALTVELPEVLAGPVAGAHATTPAIHEIPELWRAVHRARLYRDIETQGHALLSLTTERDPARTADVLNALTALQRRAAALTSTPTAQQTSTEETTA